MLDKYKLHHNPGFENHFKAMTGFFMYYLDFYIA